jgi:hypothetical protein
MQLTLRTNHDNLEKLIAEAESKRNYPQENLQTLWGKFRKEIHRCVNVKKNLNEHKISFSIAETDYVIKVSEFHRNKKLCRGELGTTTINKDSVRLFTIHYNMIDGIQYY